jgi:iron complex outermembrane receptor protein
MKINGHTVTTGNPALGAAVAVGLGGSNPSIDETYRLSSKNWSLFAQTEYDLTDALTLITGLRYSKDTKGVTYHSLVSSDGSTVELASNQSFDAVIPGVDRISKGDWAARAAELQGGREHLLFASWNRGIKGGNFTLSPRSMPLPAQGGTLNAFEGGIKWSNDSKTIRANATVFPSQKLSGLRPDRQRAAGPQQRCHGTGAEFEAWIRPVPHFNVIWRDVGNQQGQVGGDGGVEYLSVLVPGASVPQYCVDQGTGNYFCTFPAATVTNAKLPNAPRFSVNYLFRYDIDTALGNVAAQFDGAWYDGQYLEVTNGASSFQKAYNVSNASLTWTSADDRFSIEVFGRNVFNKAYRQYTLNLGPLGTTAMYAKPATYGVSASVKWSFGHGHGEAGAGPVFVSEYAMKTLLALSLLALGASHAMAAPPKPAPLKPEELTTVELKEQMPPHWVLVNDISFLHIADGRAYLIDADSGHFLGTIPGGMSHTGVAVSPDGRTAMVPGTYYSRGSRGAHRCRRSSRSAT